MSLEWLSLCSWRSPSIAVQIVGALLFFTLLIGTAAMAVRIIQRPLWAILLAIILGIGYIWAGIFFAPNGKWPVSFYISAMATLTYFASMVIARLRSPSRYRELPHPTG